MILGIGIDLQNHAFFRELQGRARADFLEKHFTAAERAYCDTPTVGESIERYAVRYAAKEAFLKALDTTRYGLAPDIDPAVVDYKSIEIKHDAYGRPFLEVSGALKDILVQRGARRNFVSLSHDKDYSLAQVILEG